MLLALPVLHEPLCVGCGDCVFVCPTQCLEQDGPLPWLPRPAECISCTLCSLICPTSAIEMAGEPGA